MKRDHRNSKAETRASDDQPTADAAWAAEADRREHELADGRVEPVTLEDVLDYLRARLCLPSP